MSEICRTKLSWEAAAYQYGDFFEKQLSINDIT